MLHRIRNRWSVLLVATALLALDACADTTDLGVASQDNAVYSAPTSYSAAVSNFALIDVQTGQVIQNIVSGDTLVRNQLPADVNLRADTSPSAVGSVRFDFDGNVGYHTQNAYPYFLVSDSNTVSASWNMPLGTHVLTATPFAASDLQGGAGTPLTVTFTIDANATVQNSNTQNPNTPSSQNPNTVTNPNTSVNPNAPVVHIYNFSTGTNDTSANVAGRIRGTLTGGATITNGVLVTQFTPSASGMQLPASVFAHYNASFSVEQWFTWTQAMQDYEAIFSISTDENRTLMAHPARGDTGLLSVDLRPGDGSEYRVATNPPSVGALTFMAIVYNATTHVMQLYINGALVDSISVPVAVNLSALAGSPYTGVGGFSPFNDPCFNGTTARFTVQPVALTAQRIAADFNNPNQAGL